jgi:NitT/TauT family transport system substrate-binding protein
MKKNLNKYFMGAVMVMIFMSAVGCTNNNIANVVNNESIMSDEVENIENDKTFIKVAAPIGSPTLSIIKMFKDSLMIGSNTEVAYECVKSPDLMASKIMSGEIDIALVPSNLAIKMYNKGIDYKYAATGVWGVLYIISSEDITTWEDLKGKEINIIGRGLTPDIVTRYLLKANGLEPDKDVKFNYVNGASELAQLFISGESTLSIMPEPMLSKVMMKKCDTKIVLDLQEEWTKVSGNNDSYPQAGIFIKNELIENHPELVEEFLLKYEESIKWVNENPSLAGEYSEEFKTGLNAELVKKAIKRSNISYKNAIDSEKALISYYEVLLNFSPDTIGGKLPDDNFYYKK